MPKKKEQPKEEFANEIPVELHSPVLTEEEAAPAFRVERVVESGTSGAKMHPSIIGGVCEFCGPAEYDHHSPQRPVKELRVDPLTQVGRCKHYNGVQIRCTYCPVSADWQGNINSRIHTVYEYPEGSGNLIVHCDAMECRGAHINRFTNRRNI